MSAATLAAAFALLLANALFVAVELGLVASKRERLEPLAAERRRSGRHALAALEDLPLGLTGAQLGITAASVGLGLVAVPAVAGGIESLLDAMDVRPGVAEGLAVGIALGLIALIHLVLGAMVPKALAVASPERTLLALARPARAYARLLRPVLVVLDALARGGVRLLGATPGTDLPTARSPEELAALIAASHREGVIEPFEHDLLTGAIRFADQPVSTVMVPRRDIDAVGLRTPLDQIEAAVNDRGRSRFPVIGRDLDDVLGFVHVKDLLDDSGSPTLAGRRLRRMLVVEQDRTLGDVLLHMQRARLHLALVVDAEGRTTGMASLEDVLEALVGEVYDEFDREGP